jgi:hypothetical protein
MMTMIDWDWPAQLEECKRRIAELEENIASQRRKIQRLLDCDMNATFAQRMLAMREESLERVQSCMRLIESRIADRAADQSGRAANPSAKLSIGSLSSGDRGERTSPQFAAALHPTMSD